MPTIRSGHQPSGGSVVCEFYYCMCSVVLFLYTEVLLHFECITNLLSLTLLTMMKANYTFGDEMKGMVDWALVLVVAQILRVVSAHLLMLKKCLSQWLLFHVVAFSQWH